MFFKSITNNFIIINFIVLQVTYVKKFQGLVLKQLQTGALSLRRFNVSLVL